LIVLVSTRQVNTGDSTSSNTGFRCANSRKDKSSKAKSTTTKSTKAPVSSNGQINNNNNDDDVINLDEL
jgi:hypothetical protein